MGEMSGSIGQSLGFPVNIVDFLYVATVAMLPFEIETRSPWRLMLKIEAKFRTLTPIKFR